MSTYLNEADSDSDGEKNATSKGPAREPLSEEQVNGILETTAALKAEGNAFFSKSEFEGALEKYTAAVSLLKESDLPKDGLILLNRSATYLALKRYVPALNDANQGTSLTLLVNPYCNLTVNIIFPSSICLQLLPSIRTIGRVTGERGLL